MIRSFIALELEDQDTIDRIIDFGSRLKINQPKLKVVEPKNLHMTIKFLGNIEESLAPKIYQILKEEINKKMFQGKTHEFKLVGTGQFRKYSVLWIKLKGNIEFLQNIKNSVEFQLKNYLNIEKDKRAEFTPHLTIARLKSNKINYKNFELFKKIIKEHKTYEFGPFNLNKIKLKRSILTPQGPIYSDLVF